MSLPETCPFCGSEGDLRNGEKWIAYTCITTIHAGHDARRLQSATCAGLERTRLIARVAELEARCKRLEEALENVINAGKPNQREHPSMWKAWLKARLVMEAKEDKP